MTPVYRKRDIMKNSIDSAYETMLLKIVICCVICFTAEWGFGVTSKAVRHKTAADLSGGETENVIVGSRGTLQLGCSAETLVEKFEDVWSINSIVVSGGAVFVGTSPNGCLYKYSLGKLTKIYPPNEGRTSPLKSDKKPEQKHDASVDANKPADANTVKTNQHLANEHIFSMATDVSGRLLAGISGDKCKLCRLQADKLETIFEPNDAKYIFAITLDKSGSIYLGTGPQGKIYKLDSSGKNPQVIYTASDKNILSLAVGEDGLIYAGSDTRGLVYRINSKTKTATILYDSDREEIAALLFARNGDLYAAATSAKTSRTGIEATQPLSLAGRPETQIEKGDDSKDKSDLKLKVANTKKEAEEKPVKPPMPPVGLAGVGQVSHIYKITPDGFVTDVFSETTVLFCLAERQQELLVGTGNPAKLFSIEPALEEKAVIYKDKQVSQITAIAVVGDEVYAGTANPARLIKLGKTFASEGTYSSVLIDANQPATWGKLQIEADVPAGCKVLAASRSGNVKDINDPTFSGWTKPAEITEPTQLQCPLGRFCQYKLILKSENGRKSPLVREVAVSYIIPNLAPRVEEVTVSRNDSTGKTGTFKISYKAKDDNDDKLVYEIDFRKVGREKWIKLEDKIEADNFEWDGKTIEDGRYEVKVTADDRRSNSEQTRLTGNRISDPVVVDNTGPVIKKYSLESREKTVTVKLKAVDELSAIGKVEYTVDSNKNWISTIPDDLVYDTTEEDFTILLKDCTAGEHVLTVKVSDDVNNVTYKTFDIDVK
jgi:hypothetical protein